MSADHKMENADHTLSIDEAAARKKVSPATIRRRIKTGEIRAFKRVTSYGFEWRIVLEPVGEAVITSADQGMITPVQSPDHIVESPDQAPELLKALEMLEEERQRLDELQHRNEELIAAAAFWQAKAQEQERTIALLQAPKDEPESAEERRPWWRRVWGK